MVHNWTNATMLASLPLCHALSSLDKWSIRFTIFSKMISLLVTASSTPIYRINFLISWWTSSQSLASKRFGNSSTSATLFGLASEMIKNHLHDTKLIIKKNSTWYPWFFYYHPPGLKLARERCRKSGSVDHWLTLALGSNPQLALGLRDRIIVQAKKVWK